MNKTLLLSLLCGAMLSSVASTASARPEYMEPTNAFDCVDCHVNGFRSKKFKPGIVEAFPIDQTLSPADKVLAIHALTIEQRAPSLAAIAKIINKDPANPDTNPVLFAPTTTYDITVGEAKLSIPFTVADAENDTYTIHGTGMEKSPIVKDPETGFDSFSLSWLPSIFNAGQTYPIKVFVRENQRDIGRVLSSNIVKATIKVWPPRANASTALVKHFALYSSEWQKGTLMLSGKVDFKDTVTLEQRNAALASLPLALSSRKGVSIASIANIIADESGNWSAEYPLLANQVPCTVIGNYEGLKVQRKVARAPRASCVY